MPDISMCTGENCPLKENCYRFKAEPSYLQSYFSIPPIKEGKCSHYWPVKQEDIASLNKIHE